MNIVQNLIAFVATLSIILYFLMLARFLKRIMLAVEKLAGMKLEKVVLCENCGKEINLGISSRDLYVNCPKCNSRVRTMRPDSQNIDVPSEKAVNI
jgi:DNA-directed RNA polymerase subunit RPC12/RpoP